MKNTTVDDSQIEDLVYFTAEVKEYLNQFPDDFEMAYPPGYEGDKNLSKDDLIAEWYSCGLPVEDVCFEFDKAELVQRLNNYLTTQKYSCDSSLKMSDGTYSEQEIQNLIEIWMQILPDPVKLRIIIDDADSTSAVSNMLNRINT